MIVRFYEGERIYLRPLELADEPLLRQWFNDPVNWRTLGRAFPVNELRERDFIEKLYKSPDDCALGIVVRDDDRLVGCGGLHRIHGVNRSAVFGLLIGDTEFQSRGYGTEASRLFVRLGFEEFNLNRIELTVFVHNQRAVRAYERAGYVLEGRQRQVYYRNGRYVDVLCYAILRSDWEQQQSSSTAEADVDRQGTPASMCT